MPKGKLKMFILMGLFFCAAPAFAITEIDLANELTLFSKKNPPVMNIYNEMSPKSIQRMGPISEMKYAEYRGDFKSCARLGAKSLPLAKEIYAWVYLTYLNCAQKIEDPKMMNVETGRAIQALKEDVYFRSGPWQKALLQSWIDANIKWLSNPINFKNKKFYSERIEGFYKWSDLYPRETKGMLYQLLADLAQRSGQKEKSDYMTKLSLEALGIVPVQKNSLIVQSAAKQKEEDLDREIADSLSRAQAAEAIHKMASALRQYPNGKIAKKYKDKPIELYLAQLDKSSTNGTTQNSADYLDALTQFEPTRIADWASQVHRKLYYPEALILAKKALESLKTSQHSTQLLWIAGRSALFTDRTDEAIDFFDQLVQFHSGTEEGQEAQFRLALIQYRMQNFALASAMFLKTIELGTDRYELSSRYWLVRSLQKFDKDRAQFEATSLISKFPYSYYGLRLLAEKNDGVLTYEQLPGFENSEKIKALPSAGKVWLVGGQESAWKRFLLLTKYGWLIEAGSEISQLPTLAGQGLLQAYWGELFAKAGQIQPGISWISKAQDFDTDSKSVLFLNAIFPKDNYQLAFGLAEKKYGISQAVFRSLIRQESAWTLKALSTSSAMGLMQMIPPTAQEIARDLKMKIQIPEDMYKPEINIPMGTYYVNQMLQKFDMSLPLALAAYNGGPTRLKLWSKGRNISFQDEIWFDELPWMETSIYVKSILRNLLLDQVLEKKKINAKVDFWQEYLKTR